MNSEVESEVQGYVDGYRDGRIYGWAWRPGAPQEMVTIEVQVDGVAVAETVAWLHRPDLAAAGIGDGRHGFAAIVHLDVDRLSFSRVVVRVKDGEPLPGNKLHVDSSGAAIEEVADPDIAAFITGVLGQAPASSGQHSSSHPVEVGSTGGGISASPFRARAGAPMNFIVYSSTNADSLAKDLGGPEYSYYFVARAFNPLLARLGSVHIASDPVEDVNRLYDRCLERGESCLFVYYAPPHRMILGSRCPTMPVIAWEFPDIPTQTWDDDPRNDWRYVLRQCAGVITLSEFAAKAVRKAMGQQYLALAVPAPVWDRLSTSGSSMPMRTPNATLQVELEGFIFDSRGYTFHMGDAPASPPRQAATEVRAPARTMLDGVVFTSVFAPKDGRKNWLDMLTAFLAAFKDTADATLVFKMIGRDPSYWWWELHDMLARIPAAACRVVVLQGFLSDAAYGQLIGATHWIVNSSVAEGLCLPLLEFMCAGRPAVAPAHTAMSDYLNSTNALLVRSDEDYCCWPQDTRCNFTTTRYRLEWSSLRDALSEAYRMTKSDPTQYAAISRAARVTMSRYCTDAAVASKIADFLGLRAAAA
jgi:glycosyltransferase involved in cell wall biosynthesis